MKINIEDDLIELILNNKKDNLSYRLTFIDMGPFIAPKNKYSDEKRVKIWKPSSFDLIDLEKNGENIFNAQLYYNKNGEIFLMKVRSKNGAELIVEYNDDSIFAENEKGQSAKLNFLNTFGKHKIKKTIVEKKYSESDEIVTEKVYNYKNGIYKSNVGEIYKDDVLSSPELASSIKELAEKFASILQMIEDECEDGAAKVHVPDEPSL